MLAELVGEHGGVEPVEAQVAAIDHFHQRVQHLCLVPYLVAEAEVLLTFHETERPDLGHKTLSPSASMSHLPQQIHDQLVVNEPAVAVHAQQILPAAQRANRI